MIILAVTKNEKIKLKVKVDNGNINSIVIAARNNMFSGCVFRCKKFNATKNRAKINALTREILKSSKAVKIKIPNNANNKPTFSCFNKRNGKRIKKNISPKCSPEAANKCAIPILRN